MRGPSRELRVIFAEEFRRHIRRPSFTIFTVLLAAVMLIAIPVTPLIVNLMEDDSPGGTPVSMERIGYVDQSGALPDPALQDPPLRYKARAEGIQAVQQAEIDTLFVLLPGYLESGEIEEYQASGKGGGRFSYDWSTKGAFEYFLSVELIAGQVEADVLARALQPGHFRSFEIGDDGAVTEKPPVAQEVGDLLVPILFAVLLMIAVLTGSGTLLRSVAEEKETRMVEMLVTSAAPFSIMAGKLLALGFAGLIQIAVWITVAAFAMPAIFDRIPNSGEMTISAGLLTTVLLSFVCGYFLFSVLALFIAAVVNSTASAQQYTGLLSMLSGLPIWMTGLFISQPDGTIAQILTYFPFTAPTMLMVRLGAGSDMSGGEIAASLLIVAATALLLLWVAARVFRAGILMAGKRMTPGNVWTALRYAD